MASDLELVPVTSQKHDPAWKHCQMYKNGDKVQLKCIYCGKFFKGGGIHRIKEHLAGQKGNASTCLRVQPDVRLQMQESLNGVVMKKRKKQKLADEITSFSNGDADSFGNQCGLNTEVALIPVAEPIEQSSDLLANQEEENGKRGGGRRKRGRMRKALLSTNHINAIPVSSSSLAGLRRGSHQIHMAIGRFFFDVGIPLDAVNSVYFQPMIDAIASQEAGATAPNYHDLRSWILKNSVQEVRNDIDQCMGTWGKTGCSLLVNEWNSEKGQTFVNFTVYCPEGVMFLKSVDVTDFSDDSFYELLKEVVEEVGMRNVLQVVTKWNERYEVIGKRLIGSLPSLFWSPCAEHCVDLMLEDFKQLEWIKTVLDQAKSISRFIYNHSGILAMTRRYTFGVDLVEVGPTPSSTDFATLKRMANVKHNLQSMVISEEWIESPYSKKQEGYVILDYISNQSFWSMCASVTRLVDPLLRALRILRCKKRPAMGYIYAAIYNAKAAIKKELVKKKDYILYWDIIDRRWEKLRNHPLHAAGFYLNPRFFYSSKGDVHHRIRSFVYDCVERLVSDPSVQDKIVKETSLYHGAEGDFGRKMAVRARDTLLPVEWWSTYGGACPNLARLATHILSQTCSLVGCKPSQLTSGQLRGRKNYVEHRRLSDLIFVHHNLRLKQVFSEDGEKDLVDPISYENLKLIEDWVTEQKEIGAGEEFGGYDWMTVDPPISTTVPLEPDVDDFEALGTGFDDHEIFNGVKDSEDEKGEGNGVERGKT